MKKNILQLLIIFVLCCSSANDHKYETVKITEYPTIRHLDGSGLTSGVNERYLPASTETLILAYEVGHYVHRVEGVEQLTNLKNLYIGYGLYDFSFLKKMKSLEVLWIQSASSDYDINLDFLSYLPNLKILKIGNATLSAPEIDLSCNDKLSFFRLTQISLSTSYKSEHKRNERYLSINSIPSNLEYIELTANLDFIVTEDLIKKLESVHYIVLDDDNNLFFLRPSQDFLDKQPNIILDYDKTKELLEKLGYYSLQDMFNNLMPN